MAKSEVFIRKDLLKQFKQNLVFHEIDLFFVQNYEKTTVITVVLVAPQVGLEPTTLRLTAECSAIELLRNSFA